MKFFISLTLGLVLVSGILCKNPALAQYGGNSYGQCSYGESCPTEPPPTTYDPPVNPDPGTEVPDENQDPGVVQSDVDGDNNDEQAIDTDGNLDNGYEEYKDPDGSSESLVNVDEDGQTGFIVDTDKDGDPDVYWNPGATYTSPISVATDKIGLGWFYKDSKGHTQVYYVERFADTETDQPAGVPLSVTNGEDGLRTVTGDNFGGEAYQKIGEFVVKLPTGVAYSFPYVLLSVLGLLIIRLIIQAKKELTRIAVVRDKILKEKELVDEKQNFLMLSSHYMRTPMTAIKGNIELMQSMKTLGENAISSLQVILGQLQAKIDTLLKDLEQDKGLAAIQPPIRTGAATRKILLSPQVLIPVIAVIVISALAQFVFIDFRVTKPNAIDLLVQTGLAILLIQVLASKVRSYQINKQNRKDQADVLNKQRELDRAKAQLVNGAAVELKGDVFKLEDEIKRQAAQGADMNRVQKGVNQLKSVINKFVFASTLQAGEIQANKEQFRSSEVINSSLHGLQETANEHKVNLVAQGSELIMVQNKQLMSIVLSSLIDNAVKYAPEGSTITVSAEAAPNKFVFTVNNQGKEVEADKLDQLFKPFSRLESAETYNQEGLGFSLYLDRLIMKYLGGEVGLQPVPGYGTKALVTVPVLV